MSSPTAHSMTIEDKVGQLLMLPITGDATVQVEELRAGSLIVMDDDVVSIRQLAGLTERIQDRARATRPAPPWLHGFVVANYRPGRAAPTPVRPLGWSFQWQARISSQASAVDLEEAARIWGKRWRSVGLHVLPVPMLNVPTFPVGIMRDTWHEGDAEGIAAQGAAIVRGLEHARCGSMGSHFPVHSATPDDSHEVIPVIDLPYEEAREHLKPYAAAIAAGLRTICTAHLRWPDVDPDNIGTLSRKILVDLLREELGFRGIVVADGIGMEGFMRVGSMAESMVAAVNAGCDSICVTERVPWAQRMVRDVLLDAVRAGRISESRLDEAVGKNIAFVDWLGLMSADPLTKEGAEAAFENLNESAFLASLETTRRQ